MAEHKPNTRSKTRPRTVAASSAAARIAQLEHDRDVLAWLFAEMIHGLRVLMAQTMLQQPQVQQALQQKLIAEMTGATNAQ